MLHVVKNQEVERWEECKLIYLYDSLLSSIAFLEVYYCQKPLRSKTNTQDAQNALIFLNQQFFKSGNLF